MDRQRAQVEDCFRNAAMMLRLRILAATMNSYIFTHYTRQHFTHGTQKGTGERPHNQHHDSQINTHLYTVLITHAILHVIYNHTTNITNIIFTVQIK